MARRNVDPEIFGYLRPQVLHGLDVAVNHIENLILAFWFECSPFVEFCQEYLLSIKAESLVNLPAYSSLEVKESYPRYIRREPGK